LLGRAALFDPASNLCCRCGWTACGSTSANTEQLLADLAEVWEGHGKAALIADHRRRHLMMQVDEVITQSL
jgi:hypothetical protein